MAELKPGARLGSNECFESVKTSVVCINCPCPAVSTAVSGAASSVSARARGKTTIIVADFSWTGDSAWPTMADMAGGHIRLAASGLLKPKRRAFLCPPSACRREPW